MSVWVARSSYIIIASFPGLLRMRKKSGNDAIAHKILAVKFISFIKVKAA